MVFCASLILTLSQLSQFLRVDESACLTSYYHSDAKVSHRTISWCRCLQVEPSCFDTASSIDRAEYSSIIRTESILPSKLSSKDESRLVVCRLHSSCLWRSDTNDKYGNPQVVATTCCHDPFCSCCSSVLCCYCCCFSIKNACCFATRSRSIVSSTALSLLLTCFIRMTVSRFEHS